MLLGAQTRLTIRVANVILQWSCIGWLAGFMDINVSKKLPTFQPQCHIRNFLGGIEVAIIN